MQIAQAGDVNGARSSFEELFLVRYVVTPAPAVAPAIEPQTKPKVPPTAAPMGREAPNVNGARMSPAARPTPTPTAPADAPTAPAPLVARRDPPPCLLPSELPDSPGIETGLHGYQVLHLLPGFLRAPHLQPQ